MPINDEFEVDFAKYCKICEHKETLESKDPCNYCLSRGFNINSKKPVCYKEIEK